MSASHDELLAKAVAGDYDAAGELFDRHGPAIRERLTPQIPQRYISILTADDVMQETYIDALLDIRNFVPRGDGSFQAWLLTVAKNNLRNAIEALDAEKRGGGRRRVQPTCPDESLIALYEMLGATESTPSRKAAGREACTAIQKAIERLPDDYQKVIRLYDLEGRPVDEVGKALGRREGAVFMLRARAHRALQKLMGSESQFFSSTA